MNIAIFTDSDFEKVNGVTTTLSAVLQHAPQGLSLRVYTSATLGVNEPQYLALRSIGVPIPYYSEMRIYLPRLRALMKHARQDRIDVIHLTTPGPIGLAALYVAWRLRLPMVGSFHTDLAAYTRMLSGSDRLGTLMREYMRWPYGRCARVLVPSEDTRQLLIDAKEDARKISLWVRGVDTELFSPLRRAPALRDHWHVAEKRPALLYVGRVSREKGLDALPVLQERLHAQGLEHRFIIVGEGPMLAELRARMPDAVFTGGLSRKAVAQVFASADFFVFPSCTDTAGNVVLEAQASGLPVAVTSRGGPRENMVDGVTGRVCGETAEEWIAGVVDLVRNQPQRDRMGKAAREYALTRTWSRALEPLYNAYREVGAEAAQVMTPAVGAMGRAS